MTGRAPRIPPYLTGVPPAIPPIPAGYPRVEPYIWLDLMAAQTAMVRRAVGVAPVVTGG